MGALTATAYTDYHFSTRTEVPSRKKKKTDTIRRLNVMVVAFTPNAALRTREGTQETAPAWEHGNGTALRIGMHSGGWQDGRLVKKKKKKRKRYICRNMRGLQHPFPPYRYPITVYTLWTCAQMYSTEVRRVKALTKIYIAFSGAGVEAPSEVLHIIRLHETTLRKLKRRPVQKKKKIQAPRHEWMKCMFDVEVIKNMNTTNEGWVWSDK